MTRLPVDTGAPIGPPRAYLRSIQIVALSLLAGVLMLTGAAIVLNLSAATPLSVPGAPPVPAPPPPARIIGLTPGDALSALAAMLLLVAGVGGWLLGGAITGQARRQWNQRTDDEGAIGAMLRQYGQIVILRCALIEGAALLGLVAFYLHGAWLGVGVALGAALVMLAIMPTTASLQRFIAGVTGREPAPGEP
jgi:hypothetical protein